jgi:hypothetical protein
VQSQVQGTLPAFVKLQGATPGNADPGNANLAGTMIAGQFVGSGSGLTSLNATNISTGTLGAARLPGVVARTDAPNVFGFTNTFNGFVGIGRSTKLNSNDFFEVKGTNASYNGIGIEGPANSKPFYGYATGGSVNCWTEYDGSLSQWNLKCDTGWVSWTGTRFGIGTKSPNAGLDVHQGNIAVTDANNSPMVEAHISPFTSSGQIEVNGPNGHSNAFLSTSAASPNYGYLGICDATGGTAAWIFIDNLGRGNLVGDIKNFREVSPRNNAEDIYYASLEGPEAAAYVRGTGHMVKGKAHIGLPQHFQDVTSGTGITVILTPKDPSSKGLGYWHGSNTGFDAFEINGGSGTYDFDWEVKAVRKGYEDYKVVRPWTESLPGGADHKRAWATRMASIAQRAEMARNQGALRP